MPNDHSDSKNKTILIALEGSDGAGKATQTQKLKQHLLTNGRRVALVSFPRYAETTGGRLLFEAMKSERAEKYDFSKAGPLAASLLFAMDRVESKKYLEDLIASHDVIIFDRYVESNLLHQGGKIKDNLGKMDFARWIHEFEYGVLGLPKPDGVIYLSVPAKISMKRAKKREKTAGIPLDAVEKDASYVRSGHEGGLFYAKAFGWKIINCAPGGKELSVEEVHSKVISAFSELATSLAKK